MSQPSIRIITPKDSDYTILKKLKRISGYTIVYNAEDSEENNLYGRIHGLMWSLQKRGYIEYERDPYLEGTHMRAKINYEGVEKLNSIYKTWATIVLSGIAAIASIFSLFL